MRLLTASVVLALAAAPAFAARRNLAGFSANDLTAHDDFSTGLVPIGFTINLFGTSYSSLYVNNNGNVTFDAPLSDRYSAVPLTLTTTKVLAPFWADVDTRGVGSGTVHYGTGVVDGHLAFGVEWPSVGYFSAHATRLNTFELVIIDRSDLGAGNFDLEYNYDSIQWEAGTANGGNAATGLGGNSARAGYSNGLSGSANVSLDLPGSAVNGALVDGGPQALVQHDLNSPVVGRYLFWLRNGVITPVTEGPGPGSNPAPAPAATVPVLILTGILLIGMVWFLRMRAA